MTVSVVDKMDTFQVFRDLFTKMQLVFPVFPANTVRAQYS